jgi:hypothetical protein
MDEEGVAASTDDERLSAMSALLITNIDLVRTIVRVEAENRIEMKFTDTPQDLTAKLTPVALPLQRF